MHLGKTQGANSSSRNTAREVSTLGREAELGGMRGGGQGRLVGLRETLQLVVPWMGEPLASFWGQACCCEQEVPGRGRLGCYRKHRPKQEATVQGFPEHGRSPHHSEVGLCALMFHIIQAMSLVL